MNRDIEMLLEVEAQKIATKFTEYECGLAGFECYTDDEEPIRFTDEAQSVYDAFYVKYHEKLHAIYHEIKK